MSDLIPIQDDGSIHDLQQERTILEVIRFMVWEKNRDGKNYTIQEACTGAGISYSTWKNWVKDGFVTAPLQKATQELHQITYGQIVPHIQEMIAVQISLAMGRIPDDSDIKEVRPADAIAAWNQIQKIFPIPSVDQKQQGSKTELEHLQSFQPGQIMVVKGDFIYNGQAGGTRMGDLPSIADEIEGEFEEK